MNPPRYRAAASGHVLVNRTRNGERVLLEDRSLWRIDPGEAARARRWPQWTRVRVEPAPGHAYWLVADVLGQRERLLAIFVGTVPHAVAPVSAVEPASPEF
jgi:hypothetical protein